MGKVLPTIKANLKARQGVKYPSLEFLDVFFSGKKCTPLKKTERPRRSFFRGNIVMKGYLGNNEANKSVFKNGWFQQVILQWHKDGYIELKDRSKDIIISGGENISYIEIEKTNY